MNSTVMHISFAFPPYTLKFVSYFSNHSADTIQITQSKQIIAL